MVCAALITLMCWKVDQMEVLVFCGGRVFPHKWNTLQQAAEDYVLFVSVLTVGKYYLLMFICLTVNYSDMLAGATDQQRSAVAAATHTYRPAFHQNTGANFLIPASNPGDTSTRKSEKAVMTRGSTGTPSAEQKGCTRSWATKRYSETYTFVGWANSDDKLQSSSLSCYYCYYYIYKEQNLCINRK